MATLRHLLALPVLALALVTGCGEAAEFEALDLDASELDERFACDDLTVVAASPDGERALLLGIDDGLAATVLSTGAPVEATYSLPDDRLTVRWVEGHNVYQGHCGRDSGMEWELDARNDAFTGEVAITLAPSTDGSLVLSAQLRDVVLSDDEGEFEAELFIAATDLENIPVD